MRFRKGFHLSINIVIGLAIGVVLIALLIGISVDFFNEGEDQIRDLAGLSIPVFLLLKDKYSKSGSQNYFQKWF